MLLAMINEAKDPLANALFKLRPLLTQAVQHAIDTFDWTSEGVDSGACESVATAMMSVIKKRYPQISVHYDYEGDDYEGIPHHTKLIVSHRKETYHLDLPYNYYEQWDEDRNLYIRIPVKITPNMFTLDEVDEVDD